MAKSQNANEDKYVVDIVVLVIVLDRAILRSHEAWQVLVAFGNWNGCSHG